AFETDAVLALPTAQIAVMGPEAAINAVYANKIASLEGEERDTFIKEKQDEYKEDIDIYSLASEMVVDQNVENDILRDEIINRIVKRENKIVEYNERTYSN